MFLIGLALGLVVGAHLGVLISALCVASKRKENQFVYRGGKK